MHTHMHTSLHTHTCFLCAPARNVLARMHAHCDRPKSAGQYRVLCSDDQDRKLGPEGYDSVGSLAAMPRTQAMLTEKGAFFDRFYVNTPICCPSRTEFFSGRMHASRFP